MIILYGSDNFTWKLFHQDTSTEESKYNAGKFLRWIFNKLLIYSPGDVLKLFTAYMVEDSAQDQNPQRIEEENTCVSLETKEIALILAQSELENEAKNITNSLNEAFVSSPLRNDLEIR